MTSRLAALLPGIRAKPLFSTTLPRSHELALASSVILAGASLGVRKRSAQNRRQRRHDGVVRGGCRVVAGDAAGQPAVQATVPPMKPHTRGLAQVGNRMASPSMAGIAMAPPSARLPGRR
jgi:hypothetical protein